ncbi:MAG: hypothetical protein UX77_C0009G0001 [Parcubacteria group bacterium GW2011_GWA1_47_11]|uniref:Uncharacterized protein n=1 Tax=Candidatus Nomurabacteria bacterium GW2011_GWB1_47_6 TaxID=1618749 RepID=A0A0G1T0K6_9BACT|nr:MAG: hypothetical protein UX77_C0009G0001 [Parcubacteria group bacterium GW2011_GWA1_47_11]KKU75299.1 MAG: hypothetical protein UY01_C0017G0015 [Candidatus Nomurabacteria bacterium GW2011_GWB1_47_6]
MTVKNVINASVRFIREWEVPQMVLTAIVVYSLLVIGFSTCR